MKRVKIKAVPGAELMADTTETGHFYLTVESRLNPTYRGELFVNLVREAVKGGNGKFRTPGELVEFCYRVAELTCDLMDMNDNLAILAPPQSAIARKVAKAAKTVKSDD